METEIIPLSGIFYLTNEISLNPPLTNYAYRNIVFKIENQEVSMDYALSVLGNLEGGAPAVYENGTIKRAGNVWAGSTETLIGFMNVLTSRFINIIYAIYGDKIKYVVSNQNIWTLVGEIENIKKIEYETNNTIRLRSATYHK